MVLYKGPIYFWKLGELKFVNENRIEEINKSFLLTFIDLILYGRPKSEVIVKKKEPEIATHFSVFSSK